MTGTCKWRIKQSDHWVQNKKYKQVKLCFLLSVYGFCNLPRINIVRCTVNTKSVTLRQRMLVFLV